MTAIQVHPELAEHVRIAGYFLTDGCELVMRMPDERVARQVLFGQLRVTRPVGSPPPNLRGIMCRDVLLLNGSEVRFMVGAGIKSAWRRLHGGLIRCYEVFSSLHDLEIHCNSSQGSP